jgi:hypothetical protein
MLIDYSCMDAASRRFDLIALVLNAESVRGGGRRAHRRITRLCQDNGDHFAAYELRADVAWIQQELTEVKAKPGEYTEESYERWRLHGLPIWAALAAGMKPTPGSRKLKGRRPNLP